MKHAFAWAEVRLDNLASNLREIRSHLDGSGADIMAVVKADAYGHGMLPVARALRRLGVRFFGVASLSEASELRRVCPRERILVLGPFSADQVGDMMRLRVTPTISSVSDALLFEKAAARRGKKYPVHVKVDTGMGRLGVWHEGSAELFRALGRMRHIDVEGVYTHFSKADDPRRHFTVLQARRFQKLLKLLPALGIRPRYVHASNSMGLARFGALHFDLVRPGIVLYGIDPAPGHPLSKKLKPVLSLKTRVAFIKDARPGRTISYGATYRTPAHTRIATLPVGYSHGYRVGFSGKSRVLIGGRAFPVIGRVTMDQTLVDIGKRSRVRRWDVATLIGVDGHARVSAEDLARLAGTIPYEIVCGIHPRIPRVYKGLVR